jgi:hypothetical protein
MAMKVIRGKMRKPVRVVIYGVEGIGKTTLASLFPNPIFLDTEGSTFQMDVARAPNPEDEEDPQLRKWTHIEGALLDLARDSQGFQTVVIDSADWAEQLATNHILGNKKSIEDFGFGKGYVMLSEQIGKMLGRCDDLIRRGLNVVFVAHSKVVRVSPPDQTDGFDRYELRLHKAVAPKFKEWADVLLFANYRTHIIEGDDGRMKAKGGKDRILFTQRTAAFDAKNRFGLAPEVPMTIEALAPIFSGTQSQAEHKPAHEPAESIPLFGQIEAHIESAVHDLALRNMRRRVAELGQEGQLSADEVGQLIEEIDTKLASLAGVTREELNV